MITNEMLRYVEDATGYPDAKAEYDGDAFSIIAQGKYCATKVDKESDSRILLAIFRQSVNYLHREIASGPMKRVEELLNDRT